MKELFRSVGAKFLIIGNLVYFGATLLAKVGNSIAGVFAKIPLIGKGLAAAIKFLFTPVRALSKFSKIVLIIDVVLIVLMLIMVLLKKKQQKKATEEYGEAIGSEEKATGLAKLMKAFK